MHSSAVVLILLNVKRIKASNFNNYLLKEPIEVSFFADQAYFPFTDTNFTEAKLDKDPLNWQKQFAQKTSINKMVLYNIKRKDNKFVYLDKIDFFWLTL